MSEPAETIAELFARDPLQLTKEDRTKIIEYYRSNREKFINSGQSGRTGGTKQATKVSSKGPLPDLDLGELDL